ncbi:MULTISPECIES: aminoglycoside adenylyltransferase family protein [Streptomyces]|uniref:aminoglycoside adenylyltransferase family protein n=1 Tax=Streptomyces TaxID=1883 RepID=UPI00224351AC|nr:MULTISPECIES: aminoglycoside adenylyltransferase family protein [unclassified Streptomyces]
MALAEQVVEVVRRVLGPAVRGAYLHGSAVLGGLRPHSDVDVFVVARRRTTQEERRALVAELLPVSGEKARTGPARPVELTVVAEGDIRPWRYPPWCEFQYGEWLREEYERGEIPAPAPSPDLALLVTVVLRGNTALYGPPPARLLDPVPDEDLERALIAAVPELLSELESDTRNAVLTLARIWRTLATGVIDPKDAAAAWALERLPARHRPVLARARAVYRGEEAEHWSDLRPALAPFAAHMAGVLGRFTPPGTGAPGALHGTGGPS